MRAVITICEDISGEVSVLVEEKDVELANALLKNKYRLMCSHITAENHNDIGTEACLILDNFGIKWELVNTYFIKKQKER